MSSARSSKKTFVSILIEKRLQELITEGTVLVDVEGAAVGQVNGLAVYQMGDFSFGKPSRITAKTFMGRGGIVNIERESKMSGKSHDKGVLILGGYLGGKYAQQTPLSLSSRSVSNSPTMASTATARRRPSSMHSCRACRKSRSKQGIAVTGSVNQNGEVQAIGGVN